LFDRRGRTEAAQQVHDRATRDGDPELRAGFALDRAEVLKQRGDVEGAAASFREASRSGTRIAPTAAFILGNLMRDQGDLAAARAAFQVAIDSGDPRIAAQAEGMLSLCED
jgi:tetratricopeptide (TPR) repeat protein